MNILKFEGSQREEFLKAMDSYMPFEMDEESWDYFLEVLPPIHMGRNVELPNGERVLAWFGFAEGAEEVTVFWKADGRYFACRTRTLNPLA